MLAHLKKILRGILETREPLPDAKPEQRTGEPMLWLTKRKEPPGNSRKT